MPLTISDAFLSEAGLGEAEARIEIACRLYDAERLAFCPAIRWSGLTRGEFEDALRERGLPVYRITREDFEQDLATLAHWESLSNSRENEQPQSESAQQAYAQPEATT